MEQQVSQHLIGMNSDVHPRNQPDGTYRTAINALHTGEDSQLISDEGTSELDIHIPADFAIIGHIDVGNDETVLFLTQERELGSKLVEPPKAYYSVVVLYNARTDTSKQILYDSPETIVSFKWGQVYNTDGLLNFDSNHPIGGIYKTKGNGDRVIYWVDGINPPRHINIDNRNEFFEKDSRLKIALHKLLVIKQVSKYPTFDRFEVLDYGGKMKVGSYNVAVRFLDPAGNATPWSGYSHTVVVYKSSQYDSYQLIEGSSNDKRFDQILSYETSKSLLVRIGNKDDQFSHYQLALVECNEGAGKVNRVSLSEKIPLQVQDYLITGDNFPFEIDELELGNFFEVIESAQTITQLHNRLVLGNVAKTTIPWHKLQKFASKIKARGVVYNTTHGRLDKQSNKHPSCNYNAGFMPGEVYCFGIVYLFENGLSSPVFHIPGVKNNDLDKEYKTYTIEGKSVRKLQSFNLLSYEIQDTYESPRASDALYEKWTNGNSLDKYWGLDCNGLSLTKTNVRFHKFPTRKELGLTLAEPYEESALAQDEFITLDENADGITLLMEHRNRLVVPTMFQFFNLYHQYLAAARYNLGYACAYAFGYSNYIWLPNDSTLNFDDYINESVMIGTMESNCKDSASCLSRVNYAYLIVQQFHIRRFLKAKFVLESFLAQYGMSIEDINNEQTIVGKWVQCALFYTFNQSRREFDKDQRSFVESLHNLGYSNHTRFKTVIEFLDEKNQIILTGNGTIGQPYDENLNYDVNTSVPCHLQEVRIPFKDNYMNYMYNGINNVRWFHITHETRDNLKRSGGYDFSYYPFEATLSDYHFNDTSLDVSTFTASDGTVRMNVKKQVSVKFTEDQKAKLAKGKRFKIRVREIPISIGKKPKICKLTSSGNLQCDFFGGDFGKLYNPVLEKDGIVDAFVNAGRESFYLAFIYTIGLREAYKELYQSSSSNVSLKSLPKSIEDKLKQQFSLDGNLMEYCLDKCFRIDVHNTDSYTRAEYDSSQIHTATTSIRNPNKTVKKILRFYNNYYHAEGSDSNPPKDIKIDGGRCYVFSGYSKSYSGTVDSCNDAPATDIGDLIRTETNNLGVEFSNISFPMPEELNGHRIVGYHIVRCKREDRDKTVLDTGVVFPMMRSRSVSGNYCSFGLPAPITKANFEISNFFPGYSFAEVQGEAKSLPFADERQLDVSILPNHIVGFITPTLLFDPDRFLPFDTVSTTGMYTITDVDIDHFVVNDVLDGSSYNSKIHDKAEKDDDGWDLYVQTRNVNVSLLNWISSHNDLGDSDFAEKVKARLKECSTVNVDGVTNNKELEYFILKALESKEYKSQSIFNLSSDNRIGVMVLPKEVSFNGYELPYVTLTKTNSSCYSDWRSRSYFPLQENPKMVTLGESESYGVTIHGGGDVFISPMRFVTSTFVDNLMVKRSTTEVESRVKWKKVWGIVLGAVGITVGVLAAVFTGGAALPLLAGLAASTVGIAAALFKSGLEVENVTRAYSEEWGNGLREAIGDMPINYVMRGLLPYSKDKGNFNFGGSSGHVGPADDSIGWVVTSLNDLWFESPVNIDLRYSYPESNVSYLRPLVQVTDSRSVLLTPWQGNKWSDKDSYQRKATGLLQNYALMKLTSTDKERKSEGRAYRGCALGELYAINPDYYRFPEQQKLFMIPDTYIHSENGSEVFKHRVYYSDPSHLEASTDSYGVFKTNNYIDIGSTHGAITNVFTLRDNLYISTMYALWATRSEMQERVTGDDLVVSLVGTGTFLNHQPQRIGDSQFALGGTRYKQSFVRVNGVVYYFSDTDGAIYAFDGNQLTPISKIGLERFFRSLKPHWVSAIGDHCAIMGLHGRHMLSVYDEKNERILFFWKDQTTVLDKFPCRLLLSKKRDKVPAYTCEDLANNGNLFNFSILQDQDGINISLFLQLYISMYNDGCNKISDTCLIHRKKNELEKKGGGFTELFESSERYPVIDFRSGENRHANAFCLSFSLKTRSWISFHTYIPIYAFSTKGSFITTMLEDFNDGKATSLAEVKCKINEVDTEITLQHKLVPVLQQRLYSHAVDSKAKSNYLWYYDRYHPLSLILAYGTGEKQATVWDSFSFKTELKDMATGLVTDDVTFTTFAARTQDQYTRMHKLKVVEPQLDNVNFISDSVLEGAQDDNVLAVFHREDIWRLNRIRSNAHARDVAREKKSLAEPVYTDLRNFTKSEDTVLEWFNREPLRGDYIEILLQYMPEDISKDIPKGTPKQTPEGTPERTPKEFGDRKQKRFMLYFDSLETSRSER